MDSPKKGNGINAAMQKQQVEPEVCAMSFSHQRDVTFGAFQVPAGNTGRFFGCIATLGAYAFCRGVATSLAAPTKGNVSH
ncbi:hypothetical protein L0665_09380 [Methanogenium marinum]|uniref:Uncharacterized protein n=1 Tax=Methanogenium marinum TaxID=348610 RepID=A0A9Q4PYW6_9EURY|nr:hypothetical protein [Methanogenium marinum]MDE4908817.1 hypothetical protein [Methanogenium marinum]